jgi:hypothetical protein
MTWLLGGLGVVFVLVVLRDIFHTLLHPAGHGQLTGVVARAAWFVARRGGPVGMRLAGPLSMVAIITTWGSLTMVGWALLYLPQLPGSFSYSSGLDPSQRSTVVDALYLSLVVGATLGFGDLVPVVGWLRLVVPLEALMGFVVFTASVTWILQIYPALAQRRGLAVRLRLLTDQDPEAAALPASVLHGLAAGIVTTRIDLQQHTETYYFHDTRATSLAAVLPATLGLGRAAADDADPQLRLAGTVLCRAIDELTAVLDHQYLDTGGTPQEIIAAYGRDHHQA